MCYTHIMHTFGEMTRRHYGTTSSKSQLPESRIIWEVLGSLQKATNYAEILQSFEQMAILMSSEYKTDAINDAVLVISAITMPIEEATLFNIFLSTTLN